MSDVNKIYYAGKQYPPDKAYIYDNRKKRGNFLLGYRLPGFSLRGLPGDKVIAQSGARFSYNRPYWERFSPQLYSPKKRFYSVDNAAFGNSSSRYYGRSNNRNNRALSGGSYSNGGMPRFATRNGVKQATTRKPQYKRERRFNPKNPPQKQTATTITKNDYGVWGPPSAIGHKTQIADDSITINKVINYDTIASVVNGILATITENGIDFNESAKMDYLYFFLCNYIANEWTGTAQPFNLEYAPAVFWDLCDAGSPRKRGNTSYRMVLASDEVLSDPSSANQKHPFGTVSGAATSGYFTLDTTATGYTDELGFYETQKVFGNAGDALDCVKRQDYREIECNDVSIFGTRITGVGGADFLAYKVNGNDYNSVNDIVSTQKPTCHWLARCSPLGSILHTTVDPNESGTHILRTFVPPSAIVADRIKAKLRGYQHHSRVVLLKPVDMTCFAKIFTQLAILALSRGSTNVTDAFSAMSFNDFKYMLTCIVSRWYTDWQAVGINVQFLVNGTYYRSWTNGSGASMQHGISGIRNFKVLEDFFSFMRPYAYENKVIYPIPFFKGDFVSTDATGITFTGPGILTAAWSWLTNLTGTTEVCESKVSDLYTITLNWNTAMGKLQLAIPTCPQGEVSRVNLACCSIIADQSTEGVLAFTSKDKMPDHIAILRDRAILPTFYISSATKEVYIAKIQAIYGEHFGEPMPSSGVTLCHLIAANVVDSVHILTGSGDPLGNTEDDKIDVHENAMQDSLVSALPQRVRKPAKFALQSAQLINQIRGMQM